MKNHVFYCFAFLLSFTFAFAQEEPCGTFDQGEMEFAGVSKIQGQKGEKAYFYKNSDTCPEAGASCKQKAYLISGDYVMVTSPTDYWGCVRYVSATGVQTTGWIKGKYLNYNNFTHATLAQWAGKWTDASGDYRVEITKAGNKLNVSGFGLYRTAGGSANTGEFEAAGVPNDDQILVVRQGECKVSMALLGDRIYVAATSECGGMNVNFDGTYKKAWK